MSSSKNTTEPFPTAPDDIPAASLVGQTSPRTSADLNAGQTSPVSPRRARASSAAASIKSGATKLLDTDLPPGFLAATAAAASKAPTIPDIRHGSFGTEGWNEAAQRRERRSSASEDSTGNRIRARSGASVNAPPASPTIGTKLDVFPPLREEPSDLSTAAHTHLDSAADAPNVSSKSIVATDLESSISPQTSWTEPPPLPWTTSFMIGLRTYLHWVITIPGFLITVYGLNIVAWGGMLFLLLCNAAPAMCHPSCNDINSPRRIWIEIDSQILNALFCVTGFGLAPWRFRDLYWWFVWRVGKKESGIRRLAGIHRDWYRLVGSQDNIGELDTESFAVPIPATKAPTPPLTGVRAPSTKPWKMDWVVWMNIWNTFLQTVLSGFMWGLNRYDRPSWSTGLFVGLACIVAAMGGLMIFQEGKKVKKIEGVAIGKEERKARGWPVEDMETGVQQAAGEESERLEEKSPATATKKGLMGLRRSVR
ncbi:hypothetical protein EJ05DRAFT_374657 [Pseudovirgaria hyperparasitica]|uniref:Uncharacterized protein n=1 Tax=Pseudovirgaria hyperparasitica TaxID=470096 RepID=A0A6A6W655_9PEZI|nr:uncharacterized protein EJ05DRAFT_374657 [Pseudovirgaria hyperparasitica]KAF2758025.1 hypothetical protein EJ05DRAFT_374657 [Pseudovirgaria hyperparasitica]